MPKCKRSLLCQLRLGILPLEVEVGRFGLKSNDGQVKRIPLEERICKLCNMNKVEDEMHFLIECTLYERERQVLFENLKICENIDMESIDGNDDKLILLMKYERKLANFLNVIWNKRRYNLYNN